MLNEKINMDVAKTILKQLGGNKFIAMTGARNLRAENNSLIFGLPKANNKISFIDIKLTEMDDYKIRFFKLTKKGHKVFKTVDNVYFDQLQEVFTEITGLNCSL